MTSPLQVLFYLAVTLAPPGTYHVVVNSGSEAYSWNKGDALDDAGTWVYDRAASDPKHVTVTNYIVPDDFAMAQRETAQAVKHSDKDSTVYFDPDHALQKTPLGWVYIVRPGCPNEKVYSFTFK